MKTLQRYILNKRMIISFCHFDGRREEKSVIRRIRFLPAIEMTEWLHPVVENMLQQYMQKPAFITGAVYDAFDNSARYIQGISLIKHLL